VSAGRNRTFWDGIGRIKGDNERSDFGRQADGADCENVGRETVSDT